MPTDNADMLDPRGETWIDLEPVTPRLRAEIAAVYREFAQIARGASERAYFAEKAEEWGTP